MLNSDNPVVVENLGGMDAIESLYYLWSSVSNEGQARCIGFNYDDVKQRLALVNA